MGWRGASKLHFNSPSPSPFSIPIPLFLSMLMMLSLSSVLMVAMQHFHKEPKQKPQGYKDVTIGVAYFCWKNH